MLLSKVKLLETNTKEEENNSPTSGNSATCKLPIDSVKEWKIVDYVKGAIVSIAGDGKYIKFAQTKLQEKDEKIAKL